MIFRIAGPGGQQMSPEQMEATQRRIYNAEFSRYLLAMILMPPPTWPLNTSTPASRKSKTQKLT